MTRIKPKNDIGPKELLKVRRRFVYLTLMVAACPSLYSKTLTENDIVIAPKLNLSWIKDANDAANVVSFTRALASRGVSVAIVRTMFLGAYKSVSVMIDTRQDPESPHIC